MLFELVVEIGHDRRFSARLPYCHGIFRRYAGGGRFVLCRLQGRNFLLQPDDVGMFARKARFELIQLLLLLIDQIGGRRFRIRFRHRAGDRIERLGQSLPLFERSDLLFAVEPQLRIEALQRGQVHLDVLRQLAGMARRIDPQLGFLPIQLRFRLIQLLLQKLRRLDGFL